LNDWNLAPHQVRLSYSVYVFPLAHHRAPSLSRPGSAAVSTAFYTELADLLDRLVTFVDPIYVVGDLNVRLDRPGESSAVQLVDLLADHRLSCRVNTPTHDQRGLLDVVITRDDLLAPSVDVVDVGLSDHHLLHWQVPMSRPPPVYTTLRSCVRGASSASS